MLLVDCTGEGTREEHFGFTRKKENVVRRIFAVSSTEGDRYYLRTLLLYVPGATSYEDMSTINREFYQTCREPFLRRGLPSDDLE